MQDPQIVGSPRRRAGFTSWLLAHRSVNLWIVQGNALLRTLLFLRCVETLDAEGINKGGVMELPQLFVIAVGAALALGVPAMLVRRLRGRRLNGEYLQARYRRDVRAMRARTIRVAGRRSDDVWSAGAAPDSPHSNSKGKKAVAYVAMASTGGCGGCGGCGCGG